MMKRFWLWLPLGLFVALLLLFAGSLSSGKPNRPQSALLGKPIPNFTLAPISPDPRQPGISSAGFKRGQPRLLNVFASWCIPCIAEAPQLLTLARAGVPIDAVAVRDRPEDLARFLRQYGNPYRGIGDDRASRVLFAMGAAGVPETFLIDGEGYVRMHHMGDIRREDVPEILAAWRELSQ